MTTNVRDLRKWKTEGTKFTMLTAYDYTTARWLDQAGIPHTGAGTDRAAANAPAIVERNGIRYGFL